MAQMVAVNIHDMPRKLYAGLPAEEQERNGTRWKVIDTPSAHLVFFPLDDPAGE